MPPRESRCVHINICLSHIPVVLWDTKCSPGIFRCFFCHRNFLAMAIRMRVWVTDYTYTVCAALHTQLTMPANSHLTKHSYSRSRPAVACQDNNEPSMILRPLSIHAEVRKGHSRYMEQGSTQTWQEASIFISLTKFVTRQISARFYLFLFSLLPNN